MVAAANDRGRRPDDIDGVTCDLCTTAIDGGELYHHLRDTDFDICEFCWDTRLHPIMRANLFHVFKYEFADEDDPADPADDPVFIAGGAGIADIADDPVKDVGPA
jgi:hypothetical protein